MMNTTTSGNLLVIALVLQYLSIHNKIFYCIQASISSPIKSQTHASFHNKKQQQQQHVLFSNKSTPNPIFGNRRLVSPLQLSFVISQTHSLLLLPTHYYNEYSTIHINSSSKFVTRTLSAFNTDTNNKREDNAVQTKESGVTTAFGTLSSSYRRFVTKCYSSLYDHDNIEEKEEEPSDDNTESDNSSTIGNWFAEDWSSYDSIKSLISSYSSSSTLFHRFENYTLLEEDVISTVRGSSCHSLFHSRRRRLRLRGGASSHHSLSYDASSPSKDNDNSLDNIARLICFGTAYIVAFDLLGNILSRNDSILVDELSSKVLSEESAFAVKTVRKILSKFSSDHGIIDVFKIYPTKDVVLSIIALSRLQRAVASIEEHTNAPSTADIVAEVDASFQNRLVTSASRRRNNHKFIKDKNLFKDLAHYAVFASVAYGWKLRLALSGKLHLGDDNLLMERTGVMERNIVASNWKSKTHRPAYFIVRDMERQNLVLSIRGTLSPRDILTDLCCIAEEFDCGACDSDDGKGVTSVARAHQGMIQAAKGVANMTQQTIANELKDHPSFNLVIVGHSLGGGTAACLGSLWKNAFPNRRISIYAYGCPCVGPDDADPTTNTDIISIVGEGDPFSTLSLGHLADLSTALSHLCKNTSLRDEIFNRTQNDNNFKENNNNDNLIWCYETMEELRENYMTAEKFYPPGRILFMGGAVFGNDGEVTLREVPTHKFRDIFLHARMLDLSRHVPNRYESALRRLWYDTNTTNNESS